THVTVDSNESESARFSGLAIPHQPQFLDLMTTAFDPVFELIIRYIEGQITDKQFGHHFPHMWERLACEEAKAAAYQGPFPDLSIQLQLCRFARASLN